MRVGDVMTQDVLSVLPESTVNEAAKIMLRERISGLPVITPDHKLVGIVTEGDLLRRAETGTEKRRPHWLEFVASSNTLAVEYVHSHGRKVREVMTSDVATVTEDTVLEEAVQMMERRRVKRLPVIRDGRVVGIIARANLLHALVASSPDLKTKADDKGIREQIWTELCKQRWNARGGNIVVRDGIVDVWGCIDHESHRQAIQVAAQNVPGVKEVRDHLVCVPPYPPTVF
jgi:CBS domain-containing protein